MKKFLRFLVSYKFTKWFNLVAIGMNLGSVLTHLIPDRNADHGVVKHVGLISIHFLLFLWSEYNLRKERDVLSSGRYTE